MEGARAFMYCVYDCVNAYILYVLAKNTNWEISHIEVWTDQVMSIIRINHLVSAFVTADAESIGWERLSIWNIDELLFCPFHLTPLRCYHLVGNRNRSIRVQVCVCVFQLIYQWIFTMSKPVKLIPDSIYSG